MDILTRFKKSCETMHKIKNETLNKWDKDKNLNDLLYNYKKLIVIFSSCDDIVRMNEGSTPQQQEYLRLMDDYIDDIEDIFRSYM